MPVPPNDPDHDEASAVGDDAATRVREAAPEFLDDPRVQQAIDVLAGKAPLEPVHRLGDGRVVRITNVRFERGEVVLTARTLSGEGLSAESP